MKKLLMLAVVVALLAMPFVLAVPSITGMVGDGSIGSDCDSSPGSSGCQQGACNPGLTCVIDTCTCEIPEFTTIGAGIALAGAGIGYSLIRKRK